MVLLQVSNEKTDIILLRKCFQTFLGELLGLQHSRATYLSAPLNHVNFLSSLVHISCDSSFHIQNRPNVKKHWLLIFFPINVS